MPYDPNTTFLDANDFAIVPEVAVLELALNSTPELEALYDTAEKFTPEGTVTDPNKAVGKLPSYRSAHAFVGDSERSMSLFKSAPVLPIGRNVELEKFCHAANTALLEFPVGKLNVVVATLDTEDATKPVEAHADDADPKLAKVAGKFPNPPRL